MSEARKCEGCGQLAVTMDDDGVPLCRKCYDALPEGACFVCGKAFPVPIGFAASATCGNCGASTEAAP